jgi:hypothetical protein
MMKLNYFWPSILEPSKNLNEKIVLEKMISILEKKLNIFC